MAPNAYALRSLAFIADKVLQSFMFRSGKRLWQVSGFGRPIVLAKTCLVISFKEIQNVFFAFWCVGHSLFAFVKQVGNRSSGFIRLNQKGPVDR